MKRLLLVISVIVSASLMLTSCAVLDLFTARKADVSVSENSEAVTDTEESAADAADAKDSTEQEDAIDSRFVELVKSYNGLYSNDVSWHFGGSYLSIAADDNGFDIVFSRLRSAPSSQVAEVYLTFDYEHADGNTVSSDFSDTWGNSGKISLTFAEGSEKSVTVNITDVNSDPAAVWGVSPAEIVLYPDDYVAEKINYSYEDYENWENSDFPEFTFDTKTKSFFYSLPEKPKNLIEGMTNDEKRNINVFLSNFSEIHFYSYGNGDADENESLLSFAFLHNTYNSTGNVFMTNAGYYAMTSAAVDTTLNRYFGRTVPHMSVGPYIYSEGNFHVEPAAGSVCSYFSVATALYDNKDGTFTVEFEVFSDMDKDISVDSSSYSCTPERARALYSLDAKGSAVVTKKTYNGTNTYELKKYSVSYM